MSTIEFKYFKNIYNYTDSAHFNSKNLSYVESTKLTPSLVFSI